MTRNMKKSERKKMKKSEINLGVDGALLDKIDLYKINLFSF
jgi:hypothetical protein